MIGQIRAPILGGWVLTHKHFCFDKKTAEMGKCRPVVTVKM